MNIGKSVVIKGELSGSEDLTIEGHVEGQDRAAGQRPDHRSQRQDPRRGLRQVGRRARRSRRQRDGVREGRHSRQRLRRRRHHLAARGDRRGCALPRQRRHAARRREASRPQAGQRAPAKPAQAAQPIRRRWAPDSRQLASSAICSRRSAMPGATPIADGSVLDLRGRRAPEADRACGEPATSLERARLSHQGAAKFLKLLQAARIPPSSISVRSSAATSRSSANSSAAGFASKTSPTDIDRHVKEDKLDGSAEVLRDALPAADRERRRHPVLGCARLPRSSRRARAGRPR